MAEDSKADIEHRTDNKEPGIVLRHLTKCYGKDKMAVNDLSVNFYVKEITALLGHNGAGKSTVSFFKVPPMVPDYVPDIP